MNHSSILQFIFVFGVMGLFTLGFIVMRIRDAITDRFDVGIQLTFALLMAIPLVISVVAICRLCSRW